MDRGEQGDASRKGKGKERARSIEPDTEGEHTSEDERAQEAPFDIRAYLDAMPRQKRTDPEKLARAKQLGAEGKSRSYIVRETGINRHILAKHTIGVPANYSSRATMAHARTLATEGSSRSDGPRRASLSISNW
jgi:hypothetical protein